MERVFTVAEARALFPEIRRQADELVRLRADLAELTSALSRGEPSPHGGTPEAKALQARLHELLSGFTAAGLQVKGVAPLLLDFPARTDRGDVLLCWVEGEAALGWYHSTDLGFVGRRPLDE